MKIDEVNIKDYTTYKLKGKMKLFVPKDISELKEILKKEKCKIIGNGSNLIIDSSYDKTLVKLKHFDDINICGNIVDVGSGYSLTKLSRQCADNGLSGLEFACGIPGTVGGAIYMNAGSFGGEISDVVSCVKVLDENNEIKVFKKEELGFSYRKSIFQDKNYIILQARFNLNIGEKEKIWKICKNNLKERKEKQPYDKFTAGSVFKKPKDYYAWELIDACGYRGYKIGGAKVSRKHCGFIENAKNAKFYDVLKIIYEIKKTVYKKFDIILEEEIQFVGDINGHFRRLSHTYDLQQKEMVSKKTC